MSKTPVQKTQQVPEPCVVAVRLKERTINQYDQPRDESHFVQSSENQWFDRSYTRIPWEKAQLDTILPFLQTVQAETFLRIRIDPQGKISLDALQDKPSTTSLQSTRYLLGQLIQQTLEAHADTESFKHQTKSKATEMIDLVPLSLRSGAVLHALSFIGAQIVSAAWGGQYYSPQDNNLRTPTECLAALLDELDTVSSISSSHQQVVIRRIQQLSETSRLVNRMDINSIKDLILTAEIDFAHSGLHRLKDTACSLLAQLNSHGPEGPPLTRVLDNVYGRVWESYLNASLIENMPPKVLEAARIMREELVEVVRQLPPQLEATFCEKFITLANELLPLPWLYEDARIQNFIQLEKPTSSQFLDFLHVPSSTGPEAAGDYFVTYVLVTAVKELSPTYFPWVQRAKVRYEGEIRPLKGKFKFRDLSKEHRSGCGITLAHHAPIAGEMQANKRMLLNRTWDLDADRACQDDSINLIATKRGIPFCTGISGYMHLFVSFFLEFREKRNLDLSHAILGLLIYLVYSGGHTWHEGLQTVNYLEKKFNIGVLPARFDPVTYVADYAQFIDVFDKTNTKEYLLRAVEYANKMTISYRRKHVCSQ